MGYYTKFHLEINEKDLSDELWEELESDHDYGEGFLAQITNRGGESEGIKWYDHDKDMLELSKKFPNVLFRLNGKGEEQGDTWRTYYKNGKMERVSPTLTWPEPKMIEIPPLDENS